MKIKKVYTENPEDEQWKILSFYTYPNNVIKYLLKAGIKSPPNDLIESVCGSIAQAKEYFDATKISFLQISEK